MLVGPKQREQQVKSQVNVIQSHLKKHLTVVKKVFIQVIDHRQEKVDSDVRKQER